MFFWRRPAPAKETPPQASPSQSQHVIFGGTNRTAEESVGLSRPDPATLRENKGPGHRVYESSGITTVAIDGPGVHGSLWDRFRGSFFGSGPTGIPEMVNTAHQALPPAETGHVKATGYSRGGVAASRFAMERAEAGRATEIDIRDPVGGGGSSLTDVSPLIRGRQQVSMDNSLPAFGATLIHGPNVSTVLTRGGHSARAREAFTAPLPGSLRPGTVYIEDEGTFRSTTRADAARFRQEVEDSRLLGVHDEDSAMAYHFRLDLPTTQQTRFSTIATLIERTTPDGQPSVPSGRRSQ